MSSHFKGHSQTQYEFDENNNKVISRECLLEDIDTAMSNLVVFYPSLYEHISKPELDKKIAQLKVSLEDSLTANAFCLRLMHTLNCIGDGHMIAYTTDFIPGQPKSAKTQIYPLSMFNYKILDNKLYLVKSDERSAFENGTEIISINNQPSKTILDSLKKFIFSDGNSDQLKGFMLDNGVFPVLYHEVFQNKKSLTLTWKHGNSTGHTLIGHAISHKPFNALIEPEPSREDFSSRHYAYLKIGTFLDMKGEIDPYASFFKTLKEQKSKTLIIDLRSNMGGSNQLTKCLLSHLITTSTTFQKIATTDDTQKFLATDDRFLDLVRQLQAETAPVIPDSVYFDGEIYLIINEGTFSSASFFAEYLRSARKITIVGAESGGSKKIATAGITVTTDLPNSHVRLSYGLLSFRTIRGQAQLAPGTGVVPDKEISYTIQEYLSKRDLEMEWIKKEIQKKGGNIQE